MGKPTGEVLNQRMGAASIAPADDPGRDELRVRAHGCPGPDVPVAEGARLVGRDVLLLGVAEGPEHPILVLGSGGAKVHQELGDRVDRDIGEPEGSPGLLPSTSIPRIWGRSRSKLFVSLACTALCSTYQEKSVICKSYCSTIPAMKAQRYKSDTLQIRLTEAEKAGFLEAAHLAGVPLSSWVRERLRMASIRELEGAGKKVPFVAPVPLGPRVANG